MAARGVPQLTLQEGIEQRNIEFGRRHPLQIDRLREAIEQRRRDCWRNRPLQPDRARELQETKGMMAEDPETMEDYMLRGWKLSDFGTKQELDK